MRRREFIAGLGGAAWPLMARAQLAAMPVVGSLLGEPADAPTALLAAAFHKGLGETGYVEGQNVTVEYRSYTALADLVRRRVAVIVAGGILPATTCSRSRPPPRSGDRSRRRRRSAGGEGGDHDHTYRLCHRH
jgi:putative tryptophan/tyrosine transport system substrate-binding protein